MVTIDQIPKYARYDKKLNSGITKEISKRIVLISDTHIACGNNPAFNPMMFRKGIEEINKIKHVDYVFHLGDLTETGTYLEYEHAMDLIRTINDDKFYIIPGNHDSRNVGFSLFEENFGGRRTFEIEDEDFYILGEDSTIPDLDAGHIGERTIVDAEEKFLSRSGKIKIFLFHHQLLPIFRTGRERSAIFDGGSVMESCLRANVDIVLNGHRHITNTYTATNGNSDMVIFNCGTLSANKTRHKELFTYTVLDINNIFMRFTTKKLLDGETFEQARFINRAISRQTGHGVKRKARIIHMGNTHFSRINFNNSLYDNAVFQINFHNPDVVIHTGSLTLHSAEEEFEMAKLKLPAIKSPTIVLPGFKDLKKYGWDRFSTMIGDENPAYEDENLKIIGINTVNKHLSSGHVGRKKMGMVSETFAEHPFNKVNVVAINHRLIPPPRLKFEEILNDAGGVLKSFTDHKNHIDLVLMGRNNVGFSIQLEDTILSFCGSVSSPNTVELNQHTFNIIEIYDNGFVIVKEQVIETGAIREIGKYWLKWKNRT